MGAVVVGGGVLGGVVVGLGVVGGGVVGGGVVVVGLGVVVVDVELDDDELDDEVDDELDVDVDDDELDEDVDVPVEVGSEVRVVVGWGTGAWVVVIGAGASLGGLVCGRYFTLPAGGSCLTGSPSSAPIMKSVQIRAGTVPPVISPYSPRLTSWFFSLSRPSPLYMPTAVASWPGVKPSNQAA